jgi:glycosyltransferase involved in cell wall biosynthesis
VRRDPPAVLHLHTPNPTMLLALALVRLPIPLVITHHSDAIRQRYLRYAVRPLEHLVYRRAGKILATSARYVGGSPLLRHYSTKIAHLPLGVNLERYLKPCAEALHFATQLQKQHGSPLWLSVGRLVYYKGLEVALEALRSVPGILLIVGTGPLEAKLRQLAENLEVADRVLWRGHATADELVGAYHAATALWFPSNARSEGFGMVQVEAMASGCPVINSAIPHSGVDWVSPHEVTGLTVPVGNVSAFAAAARRLLEDDALRSKLSKQARERACAEFGERTMALRSLHIYRDVLAKTGRR